MAHKTLTDTTPLPYEKCKRYFTTPGCTLTTDFSGDKSRHYVLFTADSISDFLKWQSDVLAAGLSGRRSSRTNRASESWDLNCGWEGFLSLLKQGWPQGVAKLKNAVAALPPSIGFGRVPDTDVAGDSLDVAAFVAGSPDHWDVDPDEDASLGQTKVIRLIVPVGALAHYSAKYLFNRGAAVVACIRSIEAAGYQCEVWAESASNGYSGLGLCQRVKVKHAGCSTDLNNLAVWLAHPATFRRGFFSGRECLWQTALPTGYDLGAWISGYGSTCYGPTEGLEAGTIYLPLAASGDHSSPEASLNTLSGVFKKAGFLLKFN